MKISANCSKSVKSARTILLFVGQITYLGLLVQRNHRKWFVSADVGYKSALTGDCSLRHQVITHSTH